MKKTFFVAYETYDRAIKYSVVAHKIDFLEEVSVETRPNSIKKGTRIWFSGSSKKESVLSTEHIALLDERLNKCLTI